MQAVAELEERFLPLFQGFTEHLSHEYPSFKFSICSCPIGGMTAYQGHILALECIFPDATDFESDCVAASISLRHLTTEPLLDGIGVAWCSGHHPDVGVEYIEHAIPLNNKAFDETALRIPELFGIFRDALKAWTSRGRAASA